MDYRVRFLRSRQGMDKVDNYILQASGLIQRIMARPKEMLFLLFILMLL